jgi:hypothetical protein
MEEIRDSFGTSPSSTYYTCWLVMLMMMTMAVWSLNYYSTTILYSDDGITW